MLINCSFALINIKKVVNQLLIVCNKYRSNVNINKRTEVFDCFMKCFQKIVTKLIHN